MATVQSLTRTALIRPTNPDHDILKTSASVPITMTYDRVLPYWQVNVPEDQRVDECPEFLLNLNAKDIRTLSTPDSEFRMQDWRDVSAMVGSNRLEGFQRWPSELRRYRHFMHKLKQEYGSVADFVLSKRVMWEEPIVPKGQPFTQESDYKILYNDWPYGFDPKIVHLVVWTKFRFEEDPSNGDLSDKSRADIEGFITKTFRSKVSSDRLLWFKNWSAIKSIHAIEHLHVLLYDPDPAFLEEITNGDIPLSRRPGI